MDPRQWTPEGVSIYLACALRSRGGDALSCLPGPLVKDLADFVRAKRIDGSSFIQLEEPDLEKYASSSAVRPLIRLFFLMHDFDLTRFGLNHRWRSALLNASRAIRQNIAQDRPWNAITVDRDTHSISGSSLSPDASLPTVASPTNMHYIEASGRNNDTQLSRSKSHSQARKVSGRRHRRRRNSPGGGSANHSSTDSVSSVSSSLSRASLDSVGHVKNRVADLERSVTLGGGLPIPLPSPVSGSGIPYASAKQRSFAFADWSNVPRGSALSPSKIQVNMTGASVSSGRTDEDEIAGLERQSIQQSNGDRRRHRRVDSAASSVSGSGADEYGYRDTHSYTLVLKKENRPLPVPPSWEEQWVQRQTLDKERRLSARELEIAAVATSSPVKAKFKFPPPSGQQRAQSLVEQHETHPLHLYNTGLVENIAGTLDYEDYGFDGTRVDSPVQIMTTCSIGAPTSPHERPHPEATSFMIDLPQDLHQQDEQCMIAMPKPQQPILSFHPSVLNANVLGLGEAGETIKSKIRITSISKKENVVVSYEITDDDLDNVNVLTSVTEGGGMDFIRDEKHEEYLTTIRPAPHLNPHIADQLPSQQTQNLSGKSNDLNTHQNHQRGPRSPTFSSTSVHLSDYLTEPRAEREELTVEEMLSAMGVEKPDRPKSRFRKKPGGGRPSISDRGRETACLRTHKSISNGRDDVAKDKFTTGARAWEVDDGIARETVKRALPIPPSTPYVPSPLPQSDVGLPLTREMYVGIGNTPKTDPSGTAESGFKTRSDLSRSPISNSNTGAELEGDVSFSETDFSISAALADSRQRSLRGNAKSMRETVKSGRYNHGRREDEKRASVQDIFGVSLSTTPLTVDQDGLLGASTLVTVMTSFGENEGVSHTTEISSISGCFSAAPTSSSYSMSSTSSLVFTEDKAKLFVAQRSASIEQQLESQEARLENELQETRRMMGRVEERVKEVEARIKEMQEEKGTEERSIATEQEGRGKPTQGAEPSVVQIRSEVASTSKAGNAWWNYIARRILSVPSASPSSPPLTPAPPSSARIASRCASIGRHHAVADAVNPYGAEPKSITGIPSYVILVSIGVCAVVLKVVMKQALVGAVRR